MGTEEREAKRRQILAAVWQVIAEQGLPQVSIRTVAAAAGVSPGRVQHYFRTREELVRESARLMLVAAEEIVDVPASGDAAAQLWELLAHPFVAAQQSRRGVGVFYAFAVASVADPELAAILAEAKGGVRDEVARLLADLGVVPADAPERARRLVAVADGLTLDLLIGGTSVADAEVALRAAVVEALPPPPSPTGRLRASPGTAGGPAGGVGGLTQLVLECGDAAALATFWRQVLDLAEPEGGPDWLTLTWPGVGRLACHRVEGYRPPVWPGDRGEQQLHLDLLVDDLAAAGDRVVAAGATPLSPVRDPGPKAWRIYADPAGHPFCLVSVPE